MTWTAGGVQTGVDADLSGLSGVTGVTVDASGGIIFYRLNAVKLTIEGILTADPRYERIVIDSFPTLTSSEGVIHVASTGTLNLGKDISVGAIPRYTRGDIITSGVAVGSGAPVCCGGWHFLYTEPGSQLNLYGVSMVTDTYFRVRGNLTIRQAAWRPLSVLQFRFDGSQNIDIDDFEMISASLILTDTVGPGSNFDNFKTLDASILLAAAVPPTDPQTDKPVLRLNNLDTSLSAINAVSLWRNCAGYELIDLALGGLTKLPTIGGAAQYGFVEQYKNLKFIINDSSSSPIPGVAIYIPQYSFSQPISASDEAFHGRGWAETAYSATADLSGEAAISNVLYKIAHCQPSEAVKFVYADKVGSGVGTIDAKLASYGKLLTTISNITCDEINEKVVNFTMFDDPLITQTDDAIVATYTDDLTYLSFYDYAQYYLSLPVNFSGEDVKLLDRDTMGIDLFSYDLDIDKNKITAPTFSGTKWTIGGDFVGNITTTGTVTLLNGPVVTGFIDDAAGVTTFVEIT